MRLGFDPWGYGPGELKAKIHSLLPNPPSAITTEQLACELYNLPDKRPPRFIKTIQRYLSHLRKEGLARSVPMGDDEHHNRLGWMKFSGERSEEGPDLALQPIHRKILRVRPKPSPNDQISVHMQEKVLTHLPMAPATSTVREIARAIEAENRLKEGEALKAVEIQLLSLQKMKIAQRYWEGGNPESIAWSRFVKNKSDLR